MDFIWYNYGCFRLQKDKIEYNNLFYIFSFEISGKI